MLKLTTILGFVRAHWLALALGGVLVAVTATASLVALKLTKQQAEIDKLRGRYSQAVLEVGRQAARADKNAEEAGKYLEAINSLGAIANQQAQQRAELNALRNDVMRMIYDAPPEDDGPISPVLARTLERLRDHETPSGNGSPVS